MLWIETQTDADARALYARMWGIGLHHSDSGTEFRVRGESLREGDEFWADAIVKLKGEPDKRFEMALRQLPLPAAFAEAATALRAMIRAARKQGRDPETLLRELHFLAAVWSFYIPYAPRLALPGYNIMARLPFGAFKAMDLSWRSLGCERLDLLTKTDRALMTAAWGTPDADTTAHERHRAIWDRYESMLIEELR